MSVGSNSDTGSHTHDPTHPSSGIEGQSANLVEGNPWLPLCASRLSALDDPKIPLTEVKDRLEQELRWIKEAKSAIESRLNMFYPIARLSPEVLAHVFRHLADIDRPAINCMTAQTHIGWIRVSYVCRSWRNVALNSPGLWGLGNICVLPNWTNERLRRSKGTLIDVKVQLGEEVPLAVVANAHRIRKISISPLISPRWSVPKDMNVNTSRFALLTSSAPSLTSFSCLYPSKSPGDRLKLPDNIFACNTPRLTHLTLENTMLTFHPTIFDNLVHLHLIYRKCTTEDDEDIPLNRKQLLELLLRIPKLETLMLEGKIHKLSEDIEPQSDEDDSPPSPALSSSVPLAWLKKLALGRDPWSWLWLMEQLSIPATASFWMHCRMDTAMQDQATVCDAFIPFMIRHFMKQDHSRPTQMLRVVCVSQGWQVTTVLAEWTDTLHDFGTPSLYHFWHLQDLPHFMQETVLSPIDFAFSSDTAPVIPVVHVLRPLLAKVCTSNIRVLQVDGTASHLDCPEWLRLFASFTAVEHISIYGMVAFNLMQALGLDLTINPEPTSILGGTSSSGPQVLFPALRSLKFCRVDFTRFVNTADALLSDIATTALTERREMNRALQEISLWRCHFHRCWFDGLRNMGFACTTALSIASEDRDGLFPLYDEEVKGTRMDRMLEI